MPTDQTIVVYLSDLEEYLSSLQYGLYLAQFLGKELLIIYPENETSDLESSLLEEKLERMREGIPSSLNTSILIEQKKGKSHIQQLTEERDAICFVISLPSSQQKRKNIKKFFTLFSECKVAYLFIKEKKHVLRELTKVAFSINVEKYSKEKSSWASYFGRFNRAEIHCFLHEYKDEFLQKKVRDNAFFVKKFFDRFQLTHYFHLVHRHKTAIDKYALFEYDQVLFDLYISLSKGRGNLLSSFFPTSDWNWVLTSSVPILFLNPRNDLYVLCD